MCRLILLISLLISLELKASVLVVSDRKSFQDADQISLKQQQKLVSFLAPYKLLEFKKEAWKNKVSGKKIAVLIHGYNNDYDDAMNYFSKIMNNSKDIYDHFVCYLWPGGDDFWEYFFAKSQASGSVLPKRLLSTLNQLDSLSNSVDVIAHSMGCRLILESLRRPSTVTVRNVFLMAPAIDNESLEKGEIYSKAVKKCEQILVFFSKNDGVVTWAYPFADLDFSLGSGGAENVADLPSNVLLVDSSAHISGHSDYAGSKFVFKIIGNIARETILSH